MNDQFNDYLKLTAYLLKSGWLSFDHSHDVECALATFENAQRRVGSENARIAMDKAARKAW